VPRIRQARDLRGVLRARLVSADWTWLIDRLRPSLSLQLVGMLCLALGSVLSLLDPLLMKWLIDTVFPRKNVLFLGLTVVAFLVIYVSRVYFQNTASLFTFRVGQRLALALRIEIFAHLETLGMRFYKEHPVGDLVQRLERDIDVICDQGADVLPALLRMFLVLGLVLATMFALSWRLAVPLLPLLLLFFLVRHHYRGQLQEAAEGVREVAARQSNVVTEALGAVTQIQLLGCQRRIIRRYVEALVKTIRATTRRRVMEFEFSFCSMLVVTIGAMTILGYGGYQVILGTLTVGGLVAFYGYVLRLFEPLSTAVELFARLHRVRASVARLIQLQATAPEVADAEGAMPLTPASNYDLCFHRMSFSYGSSIPTIKDLSFRTESGQTLFVVGSSGGGKSTIVRLLCRLYDANEGAVELNGSDVRTLTLASLRERISTVPQEPILFSATLRDNLLLAKPDAGEQELHEAAETCCLLEVIQRLPAAWDELLGPLGSRLSGGERQRVALARALLQQRPILILDEATSALDAETEAQVLTRIRDYARSRLLIVISHRLANATLADRILVMERGRIVEEGGHAELLRKDGRYAHLWKHAQRRPKQDEAVLVDGVTVETGVVGG
jgi:ABC-type multidrug transport system fused ATPase/permease subunit